MNQSDTPYDAPTEGLRLHGPLRLAFARADCWKCNKSTPVVALAAAGVEDLEFEEDDAEGADASFIHDIGEEDMPPVLIEALARLAPYYRPTYSRTLDGATWANVCEHCGALQGGFFMHNEPDGPFFGSPDDFDGELQELYPGDVVVSDASYSM
jgi:hypothetical protein